MASEKTTIPENHRKRLINDFKRFYRNASASTLDEIDRLYTQDVEFHDPIHCINGRLALRKYLRTLYTSASDIQFDYLEELVGEHSATITWEMRFTHRRLNKGQSIQVRGMTLIKYTDRIFYQEDFYDLGAMLYQHIPGLGATIRYLNRRLSA